MATTIVKTIGSGRDYSTIAAWIAGAATTYGSGLVAADVIWQGQMYAEGGGTNGEWTLGTTVSLSGVTTDSTRYVELTTASGQSFADNASKLTNALRYNNANGVAVLATAGYMGPMIQPATGMNWRISKIQFRRTSSIGSLPIISAGQTTGVVRDCIFKQEHTSTAVAMSGGSITNCLVHMTASATAVSTDDTLLRVINCTIYGTGTNAISSTYNSGSIVKNTAVFGFTNFVNNSSNFSSGSSGYNATNLSSALGSSNQTSLTASAQFTSLTGGSEDFRALSSGSLDTNGTRDQTYTSDLDIVGSSRSTTTPTIGAWEVAAATPPADPSGVTVSSVTASSGSVAWTDNSSNETGFKVRYAPSPYSSWTTATGSVAASPYIVTGLTDGTSYKAGVAAFNGNGDSSWIESGVFTTTALSKLRPNADTSAGSWSASSGSVLYSMIDETSADDADYITSTSATTCKIKFETSTDPADNSNHSLRIRARSTSGTLTVKLVQGDPAETTIVSWAPTLTSSFADYQYDLSTAEASVITDYSALYLKLTSS